MTDTNGDRPETLLTDEDRSKYYELYRQAAVEDAAASGMVLAQGEDPYSKDWSMDFDWPDEPPETIDAQIQSATLVVGKQSKQRGREGRLRAATLKRMTFDGGTLRNMREAVEWNKLKEDFAGTPDPFAYGSSQAISGLGGALGQYIPLWPGPVTRQLYWQDYWMMSAKAFEAYNHDPISWRCVHMKAEFALGRSLQLKVTKSRGDGKGQGHDTAQDVFNEFWERNKMDQRLDTIARDFCWGGEQFIRYFKKGRKLTVRSLDPASIYDLITDPEDIETVFAYHQQFQTAYQLYPPDKGSPTGGMTAPTGPSQPGAVTRYIIRQILPQEIDHYKANSSAYERRGRSDLFPALGWIKRLRDYLTAHVIQADMLARICWDLEVAGNQGTISSLRGQLFPGGRPPQPGTVFGHNTASKLTALVPQRPGGSSSRGDPIIDALVTMVALSSGLPKDWLGFGLQNTRAGALVATEPGSKGLEELQGTIEGIIYDGFNRCMAAALITDAELEITFPSIASEDRQQKLDDLGTMEANQWLSKQTAATMAAKEIGITTYNFDTEQKLIAQEFPEAEKEDSDSGLLGPDGKPVQKPKQGDGKVRRTVLIATKRQAAKLDVTKSPTVEDEPAGLLVPTDGEPVPPTGPTGDLPAPGSPDGTQRTVGGGGSHQNGVTRGGAPANENPASAKGAKNIRKDNTNIRESEQMLEMTPAQLHWLLMRERQGARRKPDDPAFNAATERFRQDSVENLRELVENARQH